MKKAFTLLFSVLLLSLMTEQASAMSLTLPNGFIFASSMATNLIAIIVIIPILIIVAFLALKYPSFRYQKQTDNKLEAKNLVEKVEGIKVHQKETQQIEPTKAKQEVPKIKQQAVEKPVHLDESKDNKFIRYAARGLVVGAALFYYIAQQKAQARKNKKK